MMSNSHSENDVTIKGEIMYVYINVTDDHSRVCLDAPPNMVDSDYINANFIYRMHGNKKVKAYIAAQGIYYFAD